MLKKKRRENKVPKALHMHCISAILDNASKAVLPRKILLSCIYERELMQLQQQSWNKTLQSRDLAIEHCTFIPSKKSSLDPFTAKPSFARLLVAPASVDISQGEHLLQRRIFSSSRSYFHHKCKKN